MTVFLIFLVIGIAILQYLSLRYALYRVYYDCSVSDDLIEPDTPFTVCTTLENQKWMFLPFVKMNEYFPKEIKIDGQEENLYHGRDDSTLTSSFYLTPNQVYQRKATARISKRGCHSFRGAVLHGGDFLGVADTMEHYPCVKEVVVIPRSVPCPSFQQTLGDFLGDMSVNRFILEDPVLTLGFREYTGHEPQRSISWTQSARMGRIMVKNYDHTLDLSVTILLNVTFPLRVEEDEEKVEQCFSMVRAICEELEQKKVKYGFCTNVITTGSVGFWSEISEGLGGNHFYSIMEGLGRATTSAFEPFSRTVDRACRKAERGRCFIIVTPDQDTRDWDFSLRRLRELSGDSVSLLTPDYLNKLEETEECPS